VCNFRSTARAVTAAALSDDLQWLPFPAQPRRIWNLTTNERVLNVRAFGGAYFGANGDAYVDFDKFEQTERTIGRMDVARRSGRSVQDCDMHAVQYGSVLVRRTHLGKDEWKSRNMTYEGWSRVRERSCGSAHFLKRRPRF